MPLPATRTSPLAAYLLAALTAALLLASPRAYAQAPAWQTLAGIAGNVIVQKTALDAGGNVYVAGRFIGTVNIGGTALTSVPTPTGSLPAQDIFVAKWSRATGAFVWAQRIGGPYYDTLSGLAVTEDGIYIAGDFGSGSVTYGDQNTVSASTQNEYGFVAKLTDTGPAGRFTWLERVVGKMTALAAAGNSVYVGGAYTETTIALGGITLTNRSNVAGFGFLYREAYLAKLTDAGPSARFAWAQPVSGTVNEEVDAIAVQGVNVYATGYFERGTLAFGGTTLTSLGSYDVFVAKLTDAGATGQPAWVVQAGGPGNETSSSIAVQGASVYVGGNFTGPTTAFGASTFTNGNTNGSADGFLAKLTDAGTGAGFAWAQQLGTAGNETVEAVAVRDQSVYIAGNLNNAAGPFNLAQFTDAGASSRLDWTKGATGGPTYAFGLAVDATRVYLSGWATAPAGFDGLTFPLPDRQTFGLLATLSATAMPLPARAATAWAGVRLYPNPARTAATVLLPAVPGAAQATLTLCDGVGRVVSSQRAALAPAGARVKLSTAGLAPGLYQLRVQAGDQYATRSLAVE